MQERTQRLYGKGKLRVMMAKAEEKPIIFSTPLIPAIQNLKPNTWPPEPIDPGKPWKWQTRRLVTAPWHKDKRSGKLLYQDKYGERRPMEEACPYPPGTRLWVRETWTILQTKYFYRADMENPTGHYRTKWRPSIHMPREAARLWLEVKSARVERLQDITEEDAIAEGTLQWICEEHKSGSYFDNAMRGAACAKPERAFALLWDTLYAKRGHPWENNDWVWVYEFMRTEVSAP